MSRMRLFEAFATLPDPRQGTGRRHPLPCVLTHAVVAVLGGCQSLTAIAQFGRDRGEPFAEAIGYTHRPLPCKASLSYLFRRLDAAAVEAVVADWLSQRNWRVVSLDGKTLSGSAEGELKGLHLLAAYAHEAQAAIAQMTVDAKTNEHKQAMQMLDLLPLEGKIVTGDAMFCQRDLSEKVLQKKGFSLAGEGRSAVAESGDRNGLHRFRGRAALKQRASTTRM